MAEWKQEQGIWQTYVHHTHLYIHTLVLNCCSKLPEGNDGDDTKGKGCKSRNGGEDKGGRTERERKRKREEERYYGEIVVKGKTRNIHWDGLKKYLPPKLPIPKDKVKGEIA